MLSRQFNGLLRFGFRDFVRIDPGNANAFIMNFKHNAKGFIFRLMKDRYQHKDDKFHRRIVVIMENDFVKRRFFNLLFTLSYSQFIILKIRFRHRLDILTNHYWRVNTPIGRLDIC